MEREYLFLWQYESHSDFNIKHDILLVKTSSKRKKDNIILIHYSTFLGLRIRLLATNILSPHSGIFEINFPRTQHSIPCFHDP